MRDFNRKDIGVLSCATDGDAEVLLWRPDLTDNQKASVIVSLGKELLHDYILCSFVRDGILVEDHRDVTSMSSFGAAGYIKVVKSNVIACYSSDDAENWRLLKSFDIEPDGPAQVGVVTFSHGGDSSDIELPHLDIQVEESEAEGGSTGVARDGFAPTKRPE